MKDFVCFFYYPRAGMGPHVGKSVKKRDIHIKLESYKPDLLGELAV